MTPDAAALKAVVPRRLRPVLRGVARRAAFTFRRATAGSRVLPDFIVPGAMKAGTSSLYAYLVRHPALLRSHVKEVHFFDHRYELGEAWYRAHFPLRRSMGPGTITGEASPYYLFDPRVPARISALLPDVKLVVMLRNPTERAISHYFHAVRMGFEDLPLPAALDAEEERLATPDERGMSGRAWVWNSYQHRGLYAQQLERYLALVPRERIFVVPSERFFEEPAAWLGRVLGFLELDPSSDPGPFAPMNAGANKRPVDPGVRARLDAYFAPHNVALRALLDVDLGW